MCIRDSLPSGDWTGCNMHFKHGRGAFFCSGPATCPWKNVFTARPSKWGLDKPSESNSTLHDTLYYNKKHPKIHAIRDNEIKEEFESNSFKARWSPNTDRVAQISSIQSYRPPLVKQFYSSHLKTWVHYIQISLSMKTLVNLLINLLMKSVMKTLLKWTSDLTYLILFSNSSCYATVVAWSVLFHLILVIFQ